MLVLPKSELGVSNFIQTPPVNERILPQSSHIEGDSAPKHIGGDRGVPCTLRNATAIARENVYWQLKRHPNLIAANFISLWPSHGSRWPVSMRQ